MKKIYICESESQCNNRFKITFVSLDGNTWQEINLKPKEINLEHYDEINWLIYGKPNAKYKPMRIAKRAIHLFTDNHQWSEISE